MRNGFLHDRVLLAPLKGYFRRLGAVVHREQVVHHSGTTGFIDLFVEHGSNRIAIEAELTPNRVASDLAKARAADATVLLIVTPTAAVARAGLKRLSLASGRADRPRVFVLPLGLAIGWVEGCFPLFPDSFRHQETNQKGRP